MFHAPQLPAGTPEAYWHRLLQIIETGNTLSPFSAKRGVAVQGGRETSPREVPVRAPTFHQS